MSNVTYSVSILRKDFSNICLQVSFLKLSFTFYTDVCLAENQRSSQELNVVRLLIAFSFVAQTNYCID